VVVTSSGEATHSFVSDNYVGEYSNQTQHLLIDELKSAIMVYSFNDPAHISLFTDGVRSLVINEVENIAFDPFWDSLIAKQKIVSLKELIPEILNHPYVETKTDDDLTIVSYFSN